MTSALFPVAAGVSGDLNIMTVHALHTASNVLRGGGYQFNGAQGSTDNINITKRNFVSLSTNQPTVRPTSIDRPPIQFASPMSVDWNGTDLHRLRRRSDRRVSLLNSSLSSLDLRSPPRSRCDGRVQNPASILTSCGANSVNPDAYKVCSEEVNMYLQLVT
jgi:hypothetical protein